MAENRNGLDVLAQLAGRLPRAPVARLPTIANSLSIIGTLEQNRLEEHSKNPQGYSDQSLVVHGPAALLLWFSARDHQGGLDSPQLSLYRALYLTADTLDALNQVYLTVPAGAPSGTGRSQWRAIDPRGDDTRRLYSQETVRPGGLPFASFVKYQDAHDFTHNRGQHNFLTGAVTFHSSGSSVKLLYAAPHVQLYDLLARWVHEDGLSSQDAAIHDSQHLVLLSIAMLMQQEGNDATQNSYEPLETRLHVALLGESPASRGTILNTLRNISLHALALCQVWDPAEPYATPWVRDHIQWCKSLRTTSHVAYPNLENPHFYRTHLERAVGVCQRVVLAHALRPNPPAPLHALHVHPAHFVVGSRPVNGQPPIVRHGQGRGQVLVPTNRQQVLERRRRLVDAAAAARGPSVRSMLIQQQRGVPVRGPPRADPPRDNRRDTIQEDSDSD